MVPTGNVSTREAEGEWSLIPGQPELHTQGDPASEKQASKQANKRSSQAIRQRYLLRGFQDSG
jgi:hypothetical protein